MPFWRDVDGTLREREGSFARYVDSLAPYFDEILLCVPVLPQADGEGTAIQSSNVTVVPLPPFEGPAQFYPRLAAVLPRLLSWAQRVDVIHCRLPTPAAIFAFTIGRWLRRPAFVLIVGDLRALLPSMPYRGLKRFLWRAYTAFEERNVQWMADRALTFVNGGALTDKHSRSGRRVIQTTTTTIHEGDIASRTDTCATSRVRALVVSRIDPRKGLRVLPQTVRQVIDAGIDLTVDIVGPTVGAPGREERSVIVDDARALGVANRIVFDGAVPLDRLLPMYAAYDVFVLPTLPGEGIPRVLLEAMSGGLPIVTTRTAGIPGLVQHDVNGLLVDEPSPEHIAGAIQTLIRDGTRRRRLIANGYATARLHTLEAQAASMMAVVSNELHLTLRAAPAIG